jgi:hypothetical protein
VKQEGPQEGNNEDEGRESGGRTPPNQSGMANILLAISVAVRIVIERLTNTIGAILVAIVVENKAVSIYNNTKIPKILLLVAPSKGKVSRGVCIVIYVSTVIRISEQGYIVVGNGTCREVTATLLVTECPVAVKVGIRAVQHILTDTVMKSR